MLIHILWGDNIDETTYFKYDIMRLQVQQAHNKLAKGVSIMTKTASRVCAKLHYMQFSSHNNSKTALENNALFSIDEDWLKNS